MGCKTYLKACAITVAALMIVSCASTKDKKAEVPDNGKGKISWDDGSLKGKGLFKNKMKTGEWTLFHKGSGEKLATGRYVNDQQQGSWTYFHKNGQKSMEGEFDQGQKTGPWTAYYPTGEKMWEATYVIRTQTEGGFEMRVGGIEGIKKSFFKNGKVWKEEEYRQGIKSGRSQEYYENGRPKEIAWFKDNKRDGKMNKWYQNGKSKEQGFYDSGKRDGNFKFFFENGQLAQSGRFDDDKLNGQWKFYSAEGLLQKEGRYSAGKETGLWTFYQYPSRRRRLKSMELPLNGGMVNSGKESILYDDSGKRTGKGQLSGIPKGIYELTKNGKKAGTTASAAVPTDNPQKKTTYSWTGKWQKPKKNGQWTEYFPGTSRVKFEATYMMNKLNGKYREFHTNGKVKAEGEYMNGKMNGMWTFYNSDGSKDEERSGRYMLGKKSSF